MSIYSQLNYPNLMQNGGFLFQHVYLLVWGNLSSYPLCRITQLLFQYFKRGTGLIRTITTQLVSSA